MAARPGGGGGVRGGLIALIENAVAVAPVVRRSSVSHAWIISTLAYSMIIDNLVGHAWGPDPIRVDPPAPLSMTTFTVAGIVPAPTRSR